MIKTFQDLDAYKNSKELYSEVIEVARLFPRDAKYLASQMCRAANSIHSNIAEGFGRSEAEFKQYLTRSLGSNNELISHLEDARLGKYISEKDFSRLTDGYTIVGKKLYRLREKWKKFS